jgi:ABC-type transporter Mla subunit MlaD
VRSLICVAVLTGALAAAGCGGRNSSSSGDVFVAGGATAASSRLAKGVASAKALAASAQRAMGRADAAAADLQRCVGTTPRLVTRTDRCRAMAATLARLLLDAARDADVATDVLLVTVASGCSVNSALCKLRQFADRVQTTIENMVNSVVRPITAVPELTVNAWVGVKETASAVLSNTVPVIIDLTIDAGNKIAGMTEPVVGIVETTGEAGNAAVQTVWDMIRAGAITARDAILQGLVTCEEAKAEGVYPRALPCP